jgi:Translation machinery associated TMA7
MQAKPLKKPKAEKDYDEGDLEFLKKKKEEAAALKALKDKAAQKGGWSLYLHS